MFFHIANFYLFILSKTFTYKDVVNRTPVTISIPIFFGRFQVKKNTTSIKTLGVISTDLHSFLILDAGCKLAISK